MKKRYFLSWIVAAALLTGCSTHNNFTNDAGGTEVAAHESGIGSAGSESAEHTSSPMTPASPESSSGTESRVSESIAPIASDTVSETSAADFAASSAAEIPTDYSGDSSVSTAAATTVPAVSAAEKTEHIATVPSADESALKDIAEEYGDVVIEEGVMVPDMVEPADDVFEMAGEYAECPEPIDIVDPIDPIEPIYPDEPWIDPQAGLLTGGEWNDNENPDFWNSLYSSNNYGVDWTGYLKKWRTGMEHRAAVTVKDSSGNPVSGAKVTGMGTAAVTDNKGRAYLFWALPEMTDGAKDFTVTYDGGSQTFTETVNGDCELEFSLDGTANTAAKSLDLMIMCDTTGSMGDELEYLKAELEDVVTRIRKDNANIPTRISVNFYRDEGDEYVVREFPFTTDLDAAVMSISQQSAQGGGDTPEAVHTALKSAVSHDWDENSVKVMFLVLDAPPHEDVQIIDETIKQIGEAAEKGIRIVPVAASGVDKSCEYLLRSMAMKTGGTYTFLTNDSGIGFGHMEPTIGSYNVEKLNDMMVRIVNGYLN